MLKKPKENKPANAGRNVVYDKKERVLKVDGVIIDKFKPLFF